MAFDLVDVAEPAIGLAVDELVARDHEALAMFEQREVAYCDAGFRGAIRAERESHRKIASAG